MTTDSAKSPISVASTPRDSSDPDEQTKHKARCDEYVSNGLSKHRTIQFLIEKLNNMGCTVPEGFIRCTDCGYLKSYGAFHLQSETVLPPEDDQTTQTSKKTVQKSCNTSFLDTLKNIGRSSKNDSDAQDTLLETLNKNSSEGAITTKRPEIFLCQQHLMDEDHTHRTIVHELIHAIDACRAKVDLQHNCIHLACTEIRAENLSNECAPFNEFLRVGLHNPRKHGQECVKRRALLSVNSHPRCRDRAEAYVDAAMARCYKDIFPFERHPNEERL